MWKLLKTIYYYLKAVYFLLIQEIEFKFDIIKSHKIRYLYSSKIGIPTHINVTSAV